MVYCTNCGTKNPDDAEKCSKCGEPLYVPSRARREEEDTCFGAPRPRFDRDFCFGIPSIIWPLLFGAFMIVWGILILLGRGFWWPNMGAIFLALIALIIIVSALFRRR